LFSMLRGKFSLLVFIYELKVKPEAVGKSQAWLRMRDV
jgi:hypothetical protein